MNADLKVNNEPIKSTSAEKFTKLFGDNTHQLFSISKLLVGSQLFKLSWDDRNDTSYSVSCDKSAGVIVAIWDYENRQDTMINLLQAEGWILKNEQPLWWRQRKPGWKYQYGKTRAIMSKNIQAGEIFSFIKPEKHMPISIFVVKGKTE